MKHVAIGSTVVAASRASVSRWPLATRAPFHLEATVRVLQRRPANRVDLWDERRYVRVLPLAGGYALVAVENLGSIDEPDVCCSVRSGPATGAVQAELTQVIRGMLGLDVDPTPFQRLAAAEPALRSAAAALRGLRPPRFAGLFETFANVVPFQQVSLDTGVTIVGRVVERFGAPVDHGGRCYYGFPGAETIADAAPRTLRGCGLSAYKAEALRRIAEMIASGALDEARIARMSTTDALRALIELPGIGPWSAALVMLRGFGRLEVIPPGDVGAERGLGELLHVQPGVQLARTVEKFGDYRGYLYFYALGASLLNKGLILSASESARPPADAELRGALAKWRAK